MKKHHVKKAKAPKKPAPIKSAKAPSVGPSNALMRGIMGGGIMSGSK